MNKRDTDERFNALNKLQKAVNEFKSAVYNNDEKTLDDENMFYMSIIRRFEHALEPYFTIINEKYTINNVAFEFEEVLSLLKHYPNMKFRFDDWYPQYYITSFDGMIVMVIDNEDRSKRKIRQYDTVRPPLKEVRGKWFIYNKKK